jgi:predicted adenine nucleotide alpha hydrolase (AANH) superfamily ATPase
MRKLIAEGHEVGGAFVNPNIHPYVEFEKRREAARQAAAMHDIEMRFEDGYGLVEFIRAVVGRETERCPVCYELRLSRVAELAKEGGYDAFTTSMLVSTHQDHEAIRLAAEAAAAAHGVEFLYRDFRPFVMEGVAASKDAGLYRQQYCGCIYSEWERYRKSEPRR